MDDVLRDLEAAVQLASDDDPVFGVWADALLERGDPRGELIALSQRLQANPADAVAAEALQKLVTAHASAWCPGCVDRSVALTWRHGFVDTLSYRPEPLWEDGDNGYEEDGEEPTAGASVRHLLGHPMATRIRSISSCCPLDAEGNHGCWGSHAGFVDALLADKRPHLRALELDATMLPQGIEHGATLPQLSFLQGGFMHEAEIKIGDLSSLWRIAPGLEHLVIAQPQDIALGDIDGPELRTLVFGSDDEDNLEQIRRGQLPKLRTLLARIGEAQQVERLLNSTTLGRIEHLGLICNVEDDYDEQLGNDIIEALLRSPRAAQLCTLDLGGLVASDAAWQKLAAAADRFGALTELRLTSWAIDPDEPIADYMDEIADVLELPERSPHTRSIGEQLASKLPVRWMLATVVADDVEPEADLFAGMFMGGEEFGERR